MTNCNDFNDDDCRPTEKEKRMGKLFCKIGELDALLDRLLCHPTAEVEKYYDICYMPLDSSVSLAIEKISKIGI